MSFNSAKLTTSTWTNEVTKIDKINYIKFAICKLDFNTQGLPSIALALPRHLLHLKSGSLTILSGVSEHFLRPQNEYLLQKIEFFLTPFLHNSQWYLPEVCNAWRSLLAIKMLIFPMFTFNPFDSRPFFHTFFILSAKMTSHMHKAFPMNILHKSHVRVLPGLWWTAENSKMIPSAPQLYLQISH